ncbi:unnamed protein product [Mytilus coruscus]|uniref:Uncharacterized protein n=1 Tax=Mytilus coruscus TaxID=42192 RepID=A0A6J8AVB6_MYTCO|nr:unnamed protein product [Mytilus coruscus]
MAAHRVETLTPKRVYFVDNLCIICEFSYIQKETTSGGVTIYVSFVGFSYIQKETTSEGVVITNKFTSKKLKLTTERSHTIEKEVAKLQRKTVDDKGVCEKCFRTVERVLRLEKEVEETKNRLLKSKERVELSSRQSDNVQKRLLRSHFSNQAEKNTRSNKSCNVTCNNYVPVKLIPFTEITNLAKYIPIATKPSTLSTVNMCDKNSSKQADDSKTVRRSLGFGSGTDDSNDGEIEKHQPDDLVTGAAAVILKECKELSRKNSGSILQDKIHNGVLTFTCDKFHKELSLRAPNVLKVVSSRISDVPVSPGEKPFIHIMNTEPLAQHSRYNQMSLTQTIPPSMPSVDKPINKNPSGLKCSDFIPSSHDQDLLSEDLTFIVTTSILNDIQQLQNIAKIYPKHLTHQYSAQTGLKTGKNDLSLFA